jgi:hypothetical protein
MRNVLARVSHQLSRQLPEASDRRDAGSERRIATERRPQHPCSRTATALCRTLHDFSSVRALNIVGLCAKVMQGTAFRRLAAEAGEKCGLEVEVTVEEQAVVLKIGVEAVGIVELN